MTNPNSNTNPADILAELARQGLLHTGAQHAVLRKTGPRRGGERQGPIRWAWTYNNKLQPVGMP